MKLLNIKRLLTLLTTAVIFFAACGKGDDGGGKHKDKSIKEYYFDVYEPAMAEWCGEVADKAPEKKQVKGKDSFPKHYAENTKKKLSYQAYETKDSNGNVIPYRARDKTQVQKDWDDEKWEEDWKEIHYIEIKKSEYKKWVSQHLEEKKDVKPLNKKVDKIHKEFIKHVKYKTQSSS